jgi:UDP-N-acetylglucosamine 2-epimerase (non-hydrolysing)
MYLICYGTRPEIIKLFPLIKNFNKNNIKFFTLFSGQHKDLYQNFKNIIPKPDFILEDIMEHNQSLNQLSSKILNKIDHILNNTIKYVIVQGDTTTAFAISLAAFHKKIKIIHLEAGLRTHNKYSPFPEEVNRTLISRIADIHLCPTLESKNNLINEGIKENIFIVGNTVVDSFKIISETYSIPPKIENIIKNIKNNYLLVTLHRRENRGEKMLKMWNQLNNLSHNHNIIYITHPSIKNFNKYLNNKIIISEPVDYISMVFLILNSCGIITDSGGLQEEAVCCSKKILVCRDTTERPETISSKWGKLINIDIENNIDFIKNNNINVNKNPYGNDVCNKILKIITKSI